MKYFVECDSCNTLGKVNMYDGFSSMPAIPRGWYQFIGPLPHLSEATSGTSPRDVCGDCAVEIIHDRMSASEWEPNEEPG